MKLSAKCHTRNNSPIPILRTREVFIYIFVYLENNSSINHIMSRYATSEMEENIFSYFKIEYLTITGGQLKTNRLKSKCILIS